MRLKARIDLGRRQLLAALYNWPRRWSRVLSHLLGSNHFRRVYREQSVLGRACFWVLEFLIFVLDILLFPDLVDILFFIAKRRGLLSEEQREVGTTVFGNSVCWDLIKLNPRSRWAKRFDAWAFVSQYTIHFHKYLPFDVLVHELMHVWQYEQYGSVYILRSLYAQRTKEGYDYGGGYALSHAVRSGVELSRYNYEQQAQIVQDYFILAQRMQHNPIAEAWNPVLVSYKSLVQQIEGTV